MNEKRPIPVVVDEKRDLLHNLWNRPLFFHQQPLVWVSFYSSTTSDIGVFLFFYSSTTSVIGLFLFIHNLWYRSL
jgi:hypothetical protein